MLIGARNRQALQREADQVQAGDKFAFGIKILFLNRIVDRGRILRIVAALQVGRHQQLRALSCTSTWQLDE